MTMKSCQLQCRDDGLLMQRLCLVSACNRVQHQGSKRCVLCKLPRVKHLKAGVQLYQHQWQQHAKLHTQGMFRVTFSLAPSRAEQVSSSTAYLSPALAAAS